MLGVEFNSSVARLVPEAYDVETADMLTMQTAAVINILEIDIINYPFLVRR
jgi:hypothetical protein